MRTLKKQPKHIEKLNMTLAYLTKKESNKAKGNMKEYEEKKRKGEKVIVDRSSNDKVIVGNVTNKSNKEGVDKVKDKESSVDNELGSIDKSVDKKVKEAKEGVDKKAKESNKAKDKKAKESNSNKASNKESNKESVDKHIYIHQGKTLHDPDTIPGPTYPLLLPDKASQKPFKLEQIGHEHIVRMLAENNGKISTTAQSLHVTHTTLKKYIDKHKDLVQILNLAKEAEVEYVESKLLDQIKIGNVASMIFYLKCHGKDRGWIEKPKEEDGAKRPNVSFRYTLVMPEHKQVKSITVDQIANGHDKEQSKKLAALELKSTSGMEQE